MQCSAGSRRCRGRRQLRRREGLHRGQKDGVDDVDDAVRGLDVRLDDGGVVDLDAVRGVDGELAALDGLGRLERGHVRGGHRAGDDVVGEDSGELLLVREQPLDGAGRQLGEGLVGRREHGERAWALEGLDQTGGLHSLDQRGEVAGGDGGVDDVSLRRGLGGAGLGRLVRRAASERSEGEREDES